MRTLCISVPQSKRQEEAKKHFASVDLDVEFINAIHGEEFGILGTKTYDVDGRSGYVIGYKHTGLVLSHYMVWQVCAMLPDTPVMVLEDDANFPIDWRKRVDAVMASAPVDTDIILFGSSNAADKPKEKVNEHLWEVKYPFCTHCYVIYRKCAKFLLRNVRDCSMPIDIALIKLAYPYLRVYTVLPRIVNQRGTPLSE